MSEDLNAVPVERFAELHCVTVRTVRRWISEGKVRAEKTPGGQQWRVFFVKKVGQLRTTADNST